MDTTRRRRSSDSNSPEFEFWMVRNPSCPQPNLLTADELFVDGVLLPLHLLSHRQSDPPDPNQFTDPESQSGETGEQEPEPELVHELRQLTAESTNGLTSSKRWKDIFKKGEKKTATNNAEDKGKEKEKRRDKKSQTATSSAELNINIWPFSRSRSAGNNENRPKMMSGARGTRKFSSAPCSRSNSAGESKSRKWPSSPGRPGVHVGRSSPIWQVKRGGSGVKKSSEAAVRSWEKVSSKTESRSKLLGNNTGGRARVLNLNVNVNVPMCIGYRQHFSCRSEDNSALGVVSVGRNKSSSSSSNSNGVVAVAGDGGGGGSHSVSNSGNNLFNFRSFFTKKVY